MNADGGHPSGTLTFLLTDIEGSTRLWERQEAEMDGALAQHDEIMRSVIAENGGYVFSWSGDAFAAVFERAGDAVAAVRSAQEQLGETTWSTAAPVQVRMGLHTGEAHERDGNYFGPVVNRAARIMAAGHGGQTLVSSTTAALVDSASVVDLGEHRLKDIASVERLFQLDAQSGSFPPLRSLSAVRNNLPVPRAPLFGREREIDRVLELLASSRLVTLTGVGGVGKTRLAVAAAAEAVDEFTDGVYFVDLIPVSSGDQLLGQIAEAVGLDRLGGQLEARLFEYLALRHVLVILDNCEHLVDDVADIVDRALDTDGRAQLLATSREDLEVEGERTLRVASLAIESAQAPGPAIELLLDRADSLGLELSAEDRDPEVLSQICARLDGIPLAIELAAARLVQFSPQELLERLDRRFDLLSGGRRRRRQRQQTLQGVMDWSWSLLDDVEQALLARLAVFTGSWGLDEVQGICAGDDDDVATTLGSLVTKSLVQRLEDAGTARFRLLETVRLYAQQQLVDRGEADDLRGRHLRWFVERTRGDDPLTKMLSLAHVSWYRRSFDNVLAAIDWAQSVGDDDAAAALVIAGTSQQFGHIGFVGRALIDVADRLLDVIDDVTTRARLLVAQTWMGWATNDVELIHRAADRALGEAQQAEDAYALVVALAMDTFYRDDQDRWRRNLAEARRVATASSAWVVGDLVDAFLDGAHYDWADMERLAVEAPDRVRRRTVVTVMDLANLSTTVAAALAIGDLELASWAVDQRVDLSSEIGVNWLDRHDEALIAAFHGDVEQARTLTDAAHRLEQAKRIGPARGEFLLVPAILADLHGRPHECAVLLAVIRANPVLMSEGHSAAIYRQLRSRTRAALDGDQLVAARSEAEQISADAALAAFLSPT